MTQSDPLAALRDRIDQLDHNIVELLNARARIVVDIGKIKQQSNAPVYAPDREKIVLERIRKANKSVGGPLPDSCLEAIYRELMWFLALLCCAVGFLKSPSPMPPGAWRGESRE